MSDSQRLHALDNLRAIMMWLGIVLHVAVNHAVDSSHLPWRDRETTLAADLAMVLIHAFRMPVFFILAGFFVAMLVSRRGYGGMFRHRLRRLALPFIVFWPLVFAGMTMLVIGYVHLRVRGSWGLDPGVVPVDPARPIISTMHMWFIYYLLWFCAFVAVIGPVASRLPEGWKDAVSGFWLRATSRWWGFVVLAIPLALVGAPYKWGVVVMSSSFVPQFAEFVHNGLFFLAGLYVYRHRQTLLDLYARKASRLAAAGLLFFVIYLVITELYRVEQAGDIRIRLAMALIYNCTTWLWCFALIGMSVRYLSNQNRFLRYMSESSYWVYLVHMLGTLGFGVLLYGAPIGALAKMGINILATTFVCIATYHLLVRYTPISTLLNGYRHAFWDKQRFGKNVATS